LLSVSLGEAEIIPDVSLMSSVEFSFEGWFFIGLSCFFLLLPLD